MINADIKKELNRIHQYEKLDMAQVYESLQKAPDIFRQFAKYFSEYIK